MKILVTGGAGFLGRWLVQRLLAAGHETVALDNLSNGSMENIREFQQDPGFRFIQGDILDQAMLARAMEGVELCIHAAAQINVQESLDHPERAFENNIIGTYHVLEACRPRNIRVVLIETCMVYDISSGKPIGEEHRTLPKSPYAASKLAAGELALSYYYGLGLPVVLLRPFNIYGPYQKSNMEGGVVSVFCKRQLEGRPLEVFGDGSQTRDLLYVEDCADFILAAAFSEKAVGQIINAGTGQDITINDLAYMVCKDKSRIQHVPHHHPQAEIQKLVCDSSRARRLLGWDARTSLEQGIARTLEWMRRTPGQDLRGR